MRFNNSGDDIEMGLLAQEVHETLAQHGLENSGMVHRPADDAIMSVRYTDLLAPMIRAIQELDTVGAEKDARIAALETQVAAQQAELHALVRAQQEQIARLEAMVLDQTVAVR